MKKVNKSPDIPHLLRTYLEENPDDNWKDGFKQNEPDGYKDVKKQLINDQKGLCAYCEIDLASGHGKALDDFRVEHFHPENPHDPPPNHALDWFNLLGVCTGGNQRSVVDNRFSKPDYSCDVPKSNKNWVGFILNPLHDIPAFPRLFKYIEQGNDAGKIEVDETLCPIDLRLKAENTLQKLRLNAPRLMRFRAAVIDELRDQFSHLLDSGLSEQDALNYLAKGLIPDLDSHLPAFFTCIRWFLADAVENRLFEIGFDG